MTSRSELRDRFKVSADTIRRAAASARANGQKRSGVVWYSDAEIRRIARELERRRKAQPWNGRRGEAMT